LPEPEPRRTRGVLPALGPRRSPSRRPLAGAALVLASIWLASPATSQPSTAFSASPSHSTDGVYQLEWTRAGRVRIDESTRPDFGDAIVIYEGTDRATTLSGRADGIYHYRLVPVDPPGDGAEGVGSTPPVRVEVAHHPLSRALAFFTLGLVVFTSTVGLVVFGDRSAAARPERHDG